MSRWVDEWMREREVGLIAGGRKEEDG